MEIDPLIMLFLLVVVAFTGFMGFLGWATIRYWMRHGTPVEHARGKTWDQDR